MKDKEKNLSKKELKEVRKHLEGRKMYALLDATHPEFQEIIQANERVYRTIVGHANYAPIYNLAKDKAIIKTYIPLKNKGPIIDNDFDPTTIVTEERQEDIPVLAK